MRVRIRGLAIVMTLVVSGCGGDPPPAAPTPQPPAVARVDIEGAFFSMSGAGETLQLRAIATLSDGTKPDVTSEATWASTDPAVLTVSSRGLVTALTSGRSTVTATYRFNVGQGFVTVR